jgi:O-antigen ligase
VTSAEIEPFAAVTAAAGVALLLIERGGRLRAAGMVAFALGAAPLLAAQGPSLARIQARPVLTAAVIVGVAGALVVATALALRFWWLVPLLMVVAGLRLPLRDPPRAIDALVPLWALVAAGLLALAWRTRRGGAAAPALGVIGYLLGGYVLVAALSLFWTRDLGRGAFEMVDTYLPFAFMVALAARPGLVEKLRSAAPAAQIGLATLFAAVAVWQYQTRHIFWDPKLKTLNIYSSFFRVNSLFFDPSLYGRFEAMALVTVVGCCLFAAPQRRIIAAAAAAPIIFAGLVPSWSQTSFAALIAALLFMAALAWRRVVAVTLTLAALGIAIGVAAAQPQVVRVVHQSINKASSSRVDLAQRGGRTYLHHPIFGVGLGGFGRAAGATPKEQRQIATHDVFLSVAAELGTIGLGLFLALLAALVLALRRIPQRAVRVVLAADLIVLVVHGSAYDQFWVDPTFWILTALIGASAAVTAPAAAVPAAGAP